MVSQGRLAEGERWLGHAARTLRPDVEPAVGMHLHCARGGLEMARGRHADAIAAFRAARQLAEALVTPHTLATPMRAHMLQALVLLRLVQHDPPGRRPRWRPSWTAPSESIRYGWWRRPCSRRSRATSSAT